MLESETTDRELMEGELLEEALPSTPALSHGLRLPPNWSFERHLTTNPDNKLTLEQLKLTLPDESFTQSEIVIHPNSLDEQRTRLAGTLFHRTARRITLDGLAHWDSARIERQKTLWRHELEPLNTDNPETELILAKLARAVTQILDHPEGQWLLAPHPEHTCEWPLNYIDPQGQMRTSILDRSFMDDGVRWIIDYKFSEPAANESLSDFLRHQQGAYREQLERYRDLLTNKTASPLVSGADTRPETNTPATIKIALYFPLIPLLHPL